MSDRAVKVITAPRQESSAARPRLNPPRMPDVRMARPPLSDATMTENNTSGNRIEPDDRRQQAAAALRLPYHRHADHAMHQVPDLHYLMGGLVRHRLRTRLGPRAAQPSRIDAQSTAASVEEGRNDRLQRHNSNVVRAQPRVRLRDELRNGSDRSDLTDGSRDLTDDPGLPICSVVRVLRQCKAKEGPGR